MDEFQKKHGLELRVGTEPEMMWLTKNLMEVPQAQVSLNRIVITLINLNH